MTPKEALQVLIDNLEYPCDKEYDIVWNALNRLEELEKLVSSTLRMDKPACERLLDLEKVLKIIKEKNFNLDVLKTSKNYKEYTRICRLEWNGITEAEFNLLKEYLK